MKQRICKKGNTSTKEKWEWLRRNGYLKIQILGVIRVVFHSIDAWKHCVLCPIVVWSLHLWFPLMKPSNFQRGPPMKLCLKMFSNYLFNASKETECRSLNCIKYSQIVAIIVIIIIISHLWCDRLGNFMKMMGHFKNGRSHLNDRLLFIHTIHILQTIQNFFEATFFLLTTIHPYSRLYANWSVNSY